MKKPVQSVNDRKLKVGIVLDTSLDSPDGVQQYVFAVSEWLRGQGHEVHYLVGETTRTDLPNIHSLSKNISVSFNGNKMMIPLWANRQKVQQLLQREQFDVLHVQTPHHPFMAQYIVNRADPRTAVIGTFHILPYNKLATISTWLLGLALVPSLRRFDRMLAVSSSAAHFEKQTFRLPASVLPNVFEYTRFMNAKSLPQYDDTTLTILFLGRLVERKGCQYLLEAIARLDATDLPSFRVVVCGKGALLPDLQQYVRDQNIDHLVEFVGYVSEADKPQYYASADISVFPSISGESFGIVLLEAMASGKSVVLAGDNPGYATVMEPKQSLLFNPKDTDKLATLLRLYLTDAAARNKSAIWGMQYVANFDVEAVGPQLVDYYQKAVDKRLGKQHNSLQDE